MGPNKVTVCVVSPSSHLFVLVQNFHSMAQSEGSSRLVRPRSGRCQTGRIDAEPLVPL